MPSSSTTLPEPPNASHRNSPAIRPPATLSDAMCETISPPAAPRSIVNTGMPASLAFWIEGTIASASVGLTSSASTPFWIRSSTLVASLAGSSCASTTISSTPAFPAASSAPSFNVTKNGLFNVDSDSPNVTPSASGGASAAGDGASVAGTTHCAATSDRMITATHVKISLCFIFFISSG